MLAGLISINWKTADFTADMLEDIDDDVSIDIDLAAALKPEENLVAAKVEKTETTDKINKVDEPVTDKLQEVKQQIAFTTSATEGDEEMTAKDCEPISPIVTDMDNNEVPLRVVEQLPEYPGGMVEFMTWVTRQLKYPTTAKQKKQQGTVSVTFVVEKDGSVTNIKFVKQTNTILDKEVLRVLRMMKKWKPGENHGKPCRSVVAIPFVFAL